MKHSFEIFGIVGTKNHTTLLVEPHRLLLFVIFYLRFILAKLASFTTMYKPNIITTPHKIARTKCCSDRSRASSLSKTVFFGGAAPFFHSFLRISISGIFREGSHVRLQYLVQSSHISECNISPYPIPYGEMMHSYLCELKCYSPMCLNTTLL